MPDELGPVPPRVAVELDRNVVTLQFVCRDHYAAIELHDRIIKGCQAGFVELTLETKTNAA